MENHRSRVLDMKPRMSVARCCCGPVAILPIPFWTESLSSGFGYGPPVPIAHATALWSYSAGMQYNTVNIPPGSTITSAWLTFPHTVDSTGLDPYPTTIDMEDSDSATLPVSYADVASRPRTTASVAWDIPTGGIGDESLSADFSAVLQEVVDRPGWASGNSLIVFINEEYTSAFNERGSSLPALNFTYV